MTVTLLDDNGALPTIFVPTTVQTAVMSVVAVLGSRPAKLTACPVIAAISVHAPVAANTNAELLSIGNTWKAYSYRRQRSTS
jgi:biotin transporter BioY